MFKIKMLVFLLVMSENFIEASQPPGGPVVRNVPSIVPYKLGQIFYPEISSLEFKKGELDEDLNRMLGMEGSHILKASFNSNNTFVRGELVAVELDEYHRSPHEIKQIYGVILGCKNSQGVKPPTTLCYVQIHQSRAYNPSPLTKLAKYLGKFPVDSQMAHIASWVAKNPVSLLTKEDLGSPFEDILGKGVGWDIDRAKHHDVSFDKNNTFARRELVVVQPPRGGPGGLVYGLVLGHEKQSNKWYVQISSEKNPHVFGVSKAVPQLEAPEDIGKMLIEESVQERVNVAPGGPVIRNEEAGLPSYEEALRENKEN